MRRLNARLFFFLVFGSALLVAVTFGVHWLQTGRIARAMLQQADRAEQQGHTDQTIRYLSRYLELEPDDLEARARLGDKLADEKTAISPRARTKAIFLIENVLAKSPERRDLRLKLVRVALLLDQNKLAREHLAILTANGAEDGEAAFLFGQVEEADEQWEQAAVWYRRAVQHTPKQLQAYVRLASVLRRPDPADAAGEKPREADQVMDRLTANNPDAYQAHLARWRYRLQWHNLSADPARLSEAAVNVRRALELAPEQIDVLLAAAEAAQTQAKAAPNEEQGLPLIEQARGHLRRAQQLHPQDSRIYREVALLEINMKQPEKAMAGLRQGAAALKGEARIEVLWMLANILLDRKEQAEAVGLLADMKKAGASVATLDYLQARLHALEGRWSDATGLLERSRELFSSAPELAKRADFLLAQCYEKLNNKEAELAAFSRAAGRDPNSSAALIGKAGALAALGQYDEALLQYQQLLKLPNPPEAAWIEFARISVLRGLQAATVDWKQIEAALSAAGAACPQAIEIPLLQAEVLAAQSKQARKPEEAEARLKQAQDLLERVRVAQPQRPEVWGGLAAIAEFRQQPQQADRIFQDAKAQLGDSARLRQLQTQLWVRRGGPAAKTAIAELSQKTDQFTADEQAKLLSDLAEAQYRLGDVAAAVQLWQKLAQLPEKKTDLRLRLLLFEAALAVGQEAALQKTIADLRALEGEGGAMWRYCQALWLLRQSRQADKPTHLDEIQKLLDAVVAQRGNWPPVHIARADLADLRGNADESIANYRRAIELGERNPRVVRQLVQQLYKRQRFAEAEHEIQKLQKQAPTGDFKRLMVAILFQQQDGERAAQQALDAVSPDSTDYRDHLWLGQVLANSGQRADQAEKHLRRAVELGPNLPETWLALVQFLAATRKTQEAQEVMNQATAKLPPDQSPLTLAFCYEALGQFDRAQEQYQKALAAKPADVLVLRGAAGYYLRTGRLDQSEPLLRKLIERKVAASPTDVGWARRGLALQLANSNNPRRYADALALVGIQLNGKTVELAANHSTDDAFDELRAQVRVLARPNRNLYRQLAISLLEDLAKRQKLPDDEQFLLAQMYDSAGDWAKARDLLRGLTAQSKSPLHLVFHARGSLRAGELSEATRCIQRLELLEKERKATPGALGTVELRAQLLEAEGQGQKAIDLLAEYVSQPKAGPERVLPLIDMLVRQKRGAQAIALCERVRTTHPPAMLAAVTVATLRAAQANADQCSRAADWLREQAAKNPKAPAWKLQLADLEDYRGRYAEAEKLYREILQQEPDNLVALNNLAWFLGQKPEKAAEALTLVNRAIELIGPQPDLLDTRASVQLTLNRSDLAIIDLEQANAERPAPTRYFHLAQAHRQANNVKAAADILKKATASGLKADQLHPVERVAFNKLLSEIEQR
ncbi:MAG: tetratricopeptide repeat protein [Planctomycetia bacterium]|nr:tetratricopeptide repeat protein [Planctomycetia bacterium]